MVKDKRKTIIADMNEEVDLLSGDGMTDQERAALQREIADANKRDELRAKPAM